MSAFIHTDGNYQEIGGKAKTVEIRDFGSPFFDRRAAGLERDRNVIGRSAPMLDFWIAKRFYSMLDEEEFHNRMGGRFVLRNIIFLIVDKSGVLVSWPHRIVSCM